MVKFDPNHAGNHLKGKEELICINTNSALIKAAESHHGKAALSCYSQNIPDDDAKILSPEKAEALETQPVEDLTPAKKQSLLPKWIIINFIIRNSQFANHEYDTQASRCCYIAQIN